MPFTGPAEDRFAIRELLDAYSDAVNMNDAAAWGALWAEDAVWSLPDFPEVGEVHGRAAIVRAWSAAMAQFPGVIFDSNPGAIEVDGVSATARCWTSEVYEQAGTTRRDQGRYDDRLVRQGGRWLFQSRLFRHVHRA